MLVEVVSPGLDPLQPAFELLYEGIHFTLILRGVFRSALPTLAPRRFAEYGERPPELDRQTPYAERHKEARDHRRQTADVESVESDVGAGAEHRRRDVNLMTD